MREGILLVNKPKGKTSFSLISVLRKILNISKIGHAGTLDPMASGLMILLVGKSYTVRSSMFLEHDKAYEAIVTLGVTTDSYDAEGKVVSSSPLRPTLAELTQILPHFSGVQQQVPPMFSAKKQNGKKLYQLARKGIEVERPPVQVKLETKLLSYEYPFVSLSIDCSKGTYVRSIAHDLGQLLGSGAHLSALVRTRSGPFLLEQAFPGDELFSLPLDEAREKVLKALITCC